MKDAKQWADLALAVQDASNLSGVVHSFVQLMDDLGKCEESTGTDWRNQHPLSRLFSDKVAHLTGTQSFGNDAVSKAYKWAFAVQSGERPNNFSYEGL